MDILEYRHTGDTPFLLPLSAALRVWDTGFLTPKAISGLVGVVTQHWEDILIYGYVSLRFLAMAGRKNGALLKARPRQALNPAHPSFSIKYLYIKGTLTLCGKLS